MLLRGVLLTILGFTVGGPPSQASSRFRDRTSTQLDKIPREILGDHRRQIRQMGWKLRMKQRTLWN